MSSQYKSIISSEMHFYCVFIVIFTLHIIQDTYSYNNITHYIHSLYSPSLGRCVYTCEAMNFRLNLFTYLLLAKDCTIEACATGKQVLVIDRMRSQSSHFYKVYRVYTVSMVGEGIYTRQLAVSTDHISSNLCEYHINHNKSTRLSLTILYL